MPIIGIMEYELLAVLGSEDRVELKNNSVPPVCQVLILGSWEQL